MFDTIVTRRKKHHQRLLAGILSVVMAFMCLPLQAFAAPVEYGDRDEVLFTWMRSDSGTGQLASKDTMVSTFDSRRAQVNVITGENYTYGGHTYKGLSDQSPSTLWVMENLIKYLLLCDWASNNMVSTESGSYRYNLFFNNTTGDNGGPGSFATENKWPMVGEELSTILEAIQGDKFKAQLPDWSNNDMSNYIGKLTTTSQWSSVRATTRSSSVRPGSEQNFGSLVQQIWINYYRPQMAYALGMGNLDEGDRTSLGAMSIASDAAAVEQAVIDKYLQQKQDNATTTEVTTTPGGSTVTTTTDNYEFKNSFDSAHAMLLGDSIAYKVATDKSWIAEDEFAGYQYFGHNAWASDTPSASEPSYLVFSDGSLAIPDSIDSSKIADDVSDIFIFWGYDFFKVQAESNGMTPLDYLNSDLEQVGRNFGSFFVSCASAQYNGTKRTDSNPLAVRLCTIPLTGDATEDAWITVYNEELKKVVSEFTADEERPSWLHFECIDMGSADISSGNAVYSALGNVLDFRGQLTGIDSSGNQVTLPNVEGKSGLNTADLITIYNNGGGTVQEFLDSYNSIVTFVNQLYDYHYENEPESQNGDMFGYYYDRKGHILETILFKTKLIDDIYEKAYKPNLIGISDPNGGGEPGGDPNKDVDSAGDSALKLISNCDIGLNHEITCADGDGNEELTGIGYTALAAGVVYDPFVSIEGNDSYMAVVMDNLESLGATDDSISKIERFLHQALARKKPVYVIDGKRDQWLKEEDVEKAPTGNYRYAYVADLLQGDTNTTRCYTVMTGGMAPSSVDSDTWVYSKGTPTASAEEGGGRVDDGVSYGTDSAGTPAGSSTMATANEMSAPIMYTSGTTEGFWSGNSAGSADGWAASLGGLTTVILHNAAQDAKDNEYIKHADSYMLFMNGLGDIVLADGTIVLPAIANPAIYHYDSIQYTVDGSTSIGSILGAAAGGIITGALIIGGTITTAGVAVPFIVGAAAAGGSVAGAWLETGAQAVTDFFWSESDSKAVLDAYEKDYSYYPYSAAFMNHYPSSSVNVEKKLTVTNSNDKGKYVIGIDAHGDVLARRIMGFNNKTQVNLQYSGGGVTVARPQALSFNVESDITRIGTLLPYFGGEDGDFWSKANQAVKFEFFMCKNSAYNSSDQAFFPLEDSNEAILQDDYLNRAGPLLTSAKRYLMERHPTGESTAAHPAFNAQRYILHMAGQGLMGTMYSETLQKNYQISYDELVQDTGNRLLTFFVQLVESAVDTLGNIDGVLAIKNGYENEFFNMLVSFIQDFYGLIAVVLLIIVAVKFLKGHYNMLFVLFIGAMCFCGFEVYANWMPTLVPNLYNFAVNDAVEQIVWNTVAVSAESYSETYRDSSRKDPTTGEPKPYTATMTLYKMSQQDMRDMASRLGTTYADIKKGTIYYLDESAGIFVQGDAIKISIDKLLVNNSMRGLHQSQWQQLDAEFADSDSFITPITKDTDMIANPYSVQITNPYVSLEAYYMPFNEIERAFLIQLNKFASLFRMEHNVYNYGRNLYKDSFLFNNYTNSGIFTAPGDKDVLMENVRIGSVVSRLMDPDHAMEDFLYRIYGDEGDKDGAVFPVPEDWLGVAAVFRSPSENFKDSLWGKAMKNKGWYDDDWNIINPDKLNDLIYYINTQTKQFVIANSDQMNFCSDENAIKIVSLYATTAFTHYTSEFGGWLYPNYVNAADISLKDALYGSMTTLKDRNFTYDGTVVNTVAYNLGVFGVIFILLITVFACVFVFVMTYLVPILYAMFGGIIVFKLINNSSGVGLVKGYVKVTAVTAILYFIFSLSMRLVEVGGYAWYGYLGCALLMFLCCYFLFWVVLSVIQNAGEMGNDVLGQNLLRGLDHITHGAVRKLTASNLTANRMNRGYNGRNTFLFSQHAAQYGRGYGVDSWDYVRGDRSRYGYNRYSDVYNEYGHDSLYEGRESRLPFFGRRQSRYEDRRTAQRFRRR